MERDKEYSGILGFFQTLVTTRIKTNSSKTGGEVGFSRWKVAIFPKKEFEKAEFITRIFKIRDFANTLIVLVKNDPEGTLCVFLFCMYSIPSPCATNTRVLFTAYDYPPSTVCRFVSSIIHPGV
jgi:hypothetical protein